MSTKWINYTGTSIKAETSFNSKVTFNWSQANALSTALFETSLSTLLFGDFTKWCTSFTAYPISYSILTSGSTYSGLTGGGVSYAIENSGHIKTNAEFGFTLGQTQYPACESFLDYEPYTKVELFLPYYGTVPLKIADIQGKYIQFRLFVDWSTGQAMYVVGVNASSVESSNAPYLIGTDDTSTRVIGTYQFQLGVECPLSPTGFIDTVRNTVMGVGKFAAAGLTSGLSLIAGGNNATPDTYTSTTQVRNPDTGRLNIQSRTTETVQRGTSAGEAAKPYQALMSTAVATAGTVLGNMNMSYGAAMPNNSCLNASVTSSIVLIKRKVNSTVAVFASEDYRHLYGLPKCAVGTLGDYSGYTKVSAVHLEGSGFAKITATEKRMIEDLLKGGVILPGGSSTSVTTLDNTDESTERNDTEYTENGDIISFSVDGTTYQAQNGMTFVQWVNSKFNTDGYMEWSASFYGVEMNNDSCITNSSLTGYINAQADDVIEANGQYNIVS